MFSDFLKSAPSINQIQVNYRWSKNIIPVKIEKCLLESADKTLEPYEKNMMKRSKY